MAGVGQLGASHRQRQARLFIEGAQHSEYEIRTVRKVIPADFGGKSRVLLTGVVDLVVEAVGAAATLTAGFEIVRKRGRIISVGAHAAESWPFPLAKSFANELTLGFAIGDSIRLRPRLLSLITTGALDPTWWWIMSRLCRTEPMLTSGLKNS